MEAKTPSAGNRDGASVNQFSVRYLNEIISAALGRGYEFQTLEEFYDAGCPETNRFAIRLDLDLKPKSLEPILELADARRVPLTVSVRVSGPYNPLWHTSYSVLARAARQGCEIALHTGPVEWAALHGTSAEKTFAGELALLRQWFDVKSVSTHRDVNYMYNSLPWLVANWSMLKEKYALKYHAYEERFFQRAEYVNEGLSPHLNWRSRDPMDVMKSGKSIYMLIHPHWWFVDHPFEHD